MEIEHYTEFEPVASVGELIGPGKRIFKLPAQPVERLPKPNVLLGVPLYRLRVPLHPVVLEVAKVPNVLVLPKKMMIDLETGRPLVDSFYRLVSSDARIRAAGIDPANPKPDIERLVKAARKLPGYTYAAASAYNGFGHILLEAYSTFWAYDLVKSACERLILNRNHRQYAAAFDALGVPSDQRYAQDRPYLVENLIVPRQSYILDRYVTDSYFAVIDRLRDNILAAAPPKPSAERLYVSRRRAAKRRLLQEEEVEVAFANAGFHVIYPEDHPLAEQVGMFSQAKIVAGSVGSALYNTLFSPIDVKRIILAPEHFYTRNDLMFCRRLKQAPVYLFGESLAGDRHAAMMADWSIDLDGVRAFVETLR